MTFFTLERVTPFQRSAGALRRADAGEVDRLAPLAIAAAREMNLPKPEQEPEQVVRSLRRAIEEGRQFVWENGGSVCAIASYVDALASRGARIRGVYTPPDHRCHGYGTAITGSLAQFLLDTGQAWVCLFADSANPVSIGIYQRLGFRPEGVYQSIRFD